MKKQNRKVVEAPSDIVIDTALILQRVGVICRNYQELSDAIHNLNAQNLIDHAAELFFKRKQNGLITLAQLLGTLEQAAA